MKRTRAEMNQTDKIQQTESNIKLPKIFDGTFFEVVELNKTNKNINARCKKCKKHVKGQCTSTGNFYKHYR